MKKFKKFVALLLAGVMAMALLTACGGGSGSKSFETQVEDAVFAVYSKAFNVSKNDSEMKSLAEKSLGYVRDGKFYASDMKNCLKVEGTTVSFAMPIPAGDSAGSDLYYNVMEITPELLGQLKAEDLSNLQMDDLLKELESEGLKIAAIGVKAKTINGKTYAAVGIKMAIDTSIIGGGGAGSTSSSSASSEDPSSSASSEVVAITPW